MCFMKKRSGRKLLTLFVLAVTVCAAAAADDPNKGAAKKEVLTTLEQKMQRKISVDFIDLPIEDVIRMMAEQADVDIIISPKVAGNVTATLTDVPLAEALENILAAHDYGYVVGKNMIRIAPLEEIAEGESSLTSRIYRVTYADVEAVEESLKNFISSRGSISSNKETSNIIVTDTEAKIKAIDTFIDEIDRMTPQILVEARIYDITSKDRLDLGVEWQGGRNTTYDTAGGIMGVGTNPGSGRIDPFITGLFSGATNKTSGTSGAIRVGWLNPAIDVDAVLKAQQNVINAKLLANPRILVLDNETALIKIVSEVPYIELTETSDGGSMGTTNFREIGVKLEVKPHFTRDKMIKLQLNPEFSVQTGTVEVGKTTGDYPQPVVDRREASTTLLIRDGQTVVLGGLRKKEVTKQTNKIPLLGDLPLAGILFRFEGEDTVTSELVVFVTPWIIKQPTMSEIEQKQFGETNFSGPDITYTRAEKAEK